MIPPLRSLFLVLTLLVSVASATAATVTGTVTSASTRQPLRGMVVAAYDAAGSLRGTATTDATGLYLLSLPAGIYRILAYDLTGFYATMFEGNAEAFELSPEHTLGSADTLRVDFALEQGGVVIGTVRDPGGTVRANVTVAAYNLSGSRRGFTTTDGNGNYSLVLPPGEYKLIAYDETGTFAASFYLNAADFSAATPVAVTAGQTRAAIDFRLGVAARILGDVTDAATRAPLPSINVYAFTESGVLVATTTTDANGVFRFSLPAGRYRFVAADPGRTYATTYFANRRSFATANVVEIASGGSATVQLAATRGARLAGRVTNADGTPLPNITVAAYNPDGTEQTSVTTDANGRFELVVAGDVRVAAFDPSLTYATRFFSGSHTFRRSDPIRTNPGDRIASFDFALARGARVNGTVTDSATSQRLGGIVVGAYDLEGALVAEATTDADGRYSLVVAAGQHRFLAFDPQLRYATRYDRNAPTFETTAARVLDASTTSTIDFAITRGVRVTGTITDTTGTRISGVEVFALDAEGNRVGGGIANDGTFSLVLPPGSYRFVAIDPQGRFATTFGTTITVAEGSTPPITFSLRTLVRRRGVAR